MIRLGVDVSNYTGTVTIEDAIAIRAAGYTFAIVGNQTGNDGHYYAPQQMAGFKAGGIEVIGVYDLLYWNDGDTKRMHDAAALGLPVWVDAEATLPPGFAPEDAVKALHGACDYLAGLDQLGGIYTGAWWWNPSTRQSHEFAVVPLWSAGYTAPSGTVGPEPDFDTFPTYGGWRRPEIWQYAGSVKIAGVLCDLNAMEVVDAVPPVTYSQEYLQMAAAAAMYRHYKYEVVGTNPLGQLVCRLHEQDGSVSQPESYVAVDKPTN